MLKACPVSIEISFGARITGLRHGDLSNPSVRQELNALWLREGLLVFSEGDSSAEFQIELSRVFGELERHPVREYWVEGFPELIGLKAEEFLYEVDGVVLGGWVPWHVDTIYTTKVCRGGLLRAVRVPSEGGQTGFVDRIEAYDRLAPDMKRRIDGLEIVYRFSNDLDDLPYATRQKAARIGLTARQNAVKGRLNEDFKPIVYPLVYAHPKTGRKVLNVSPMFALSIKDMRPEESDTLLTELVTHISDERCAYFHDWRDGDLTLWDNWRLLHKGRGTRFPDTREMHRTTIAGGWESGRALQ